jgi:hypothetical protein
LASRKLEMTQPVNKTDLHFPASRSSEPEMTQSDLLGVRRWPGVLGQNSSYDYHVAYRPHSSTSTEFFWDLTPLLTRHWETGASIVTTPSETDIRIADIRVNVSEIRIYGMITVVSGLPRSGTSLMMQMIQAGGIAALTDGLRSPDEDNPRGYLEFEAVKKTRQDPSWLNDADGKVVKLVHLLLYDLPNDRKYRVVFMRRRIDEVLASQRKMLQRQGKPGAAISDAQLSAVFQSQIDKLFAWLPQQPHLSLLEVAYNELLIDAKPIITRINTFLGGGLHESAMLAAIDPSLYRNRS